MQLSPQTYSRLAELLRTAGDTRRATPGAEVRGPALAAPPEDRPRWQIVYAHDVNAEGSGLLAPGPAQVGHQLVLSVGDAAGGLSIVCGVVHCRPLARDLYGLGLSFLKAEHRQAAGGGVAEELERFLDVEEATRAALFGL